MAGCVLRVRKDGVEPEALMSSGVFTGARRFKDGFNFIISESEKFDEQLRDSEAFLRANDDECRNLSSQLKPETPVLDFGVWGGVKIRFSQLHFHPPWFLSLVILVLTYAHHSMKQVTYNKSLNADAEQVFGW